MTLPVCLLASYHIRTKIHQYYVQFTMEYINIEYLLPNWQLACPVPIFNQNNAGDGENVWKTLQTNVKGRVMIIGPPKKNIWP